MTGRCYNAETRGAEKRRPRVMTAEVGASWGARTADRGGLWDRWLRRGTGDQQLYVREVCKTPTVRARRAVEEEAPPISVARSTRRTVRSTCGMLVWV